MTKPKHPPGEIAIERNITRRCDGFAFRVRMMAQGIRYDETFHSLQDARAFRDRKRSDITLDPAAQLVHAARLARQSANLTLGELLKRYQAEVTPTKKGARAERLRINKLLRFPIAQLPARLVGREALLQFMKSPEEDWNGNNLRKYLMILSALFNVAIKRWGMALTNPVPSIEMPSNGPSRKRRLEDQEHEYLTASLRKSRSPYMAPLVQVAIETACRRGELLRLDWKDVDLKGRTATLRDTKNGEDRTIPLSSVAIKLLSELPGTHTGLVFPLREERVRCAFDMGKKRAQPDGSYADLPELDLGAVALALQLCMAERKDELITDTRWAGAAWNSPQGIWVPLLRLARAVRENLAGPDFVPVNA